MNDIQNAFIILVIVFIIIIIITLLYQKQNEKKYLETFTNYQDVKTKTINWCTKMQNAGLLNAEQYDSCINTFQDQTKGILPKEFKTPNTGMSINYSLYNTNSESLVSNVTGENSNTIMLVNNEGYYMACNKDDDVYFIKDINDSSLNQNEIYFTMLPQKNNIYMFMSSYGKYLIANSGPSVNDTTIPTGMSSRQDWCAAFTGEKMGSMTNWNVKVLESNNNSNGNKAVFESVQLNNFFLSSVQNNKDNTLILNYGNDDKNIWTMIPKEVSKSTTDSIANYNAQYIVLKDNILTKQSQIKAEIIYTQEIKNSLVKLQNIIKNNFNNIKDHVYKIINNNTVAIITSPTNIGQLPVPDYNPSITIQDFASEKNIKESFIDDIELKKNLNMSINDKNTVINNILNMKNNYIQELESEISNINILLIELQKKELEIDNDYKKFINKLKNKLSKTKNKIEQNNIIMNRQKNNYDKLNNDFAYIDKQKEKTDKIDEIAKINTDLISKTSDSNSMLVIIYPLIIFIMIICLLYLTYLTYNKFIVNVYGYY